MAAAAVENGTNYNDQQFLLGNALLIRPLKKSLAKLNAHGGFIGARFFTFETLTKQTNAHFSQRLINHHERVFLLSNILKSFPRFIGHASTIQLAEELLRLFDELQLQKTVLPDTPTEMETFLKGVYKVNSDYAYLSFQADIVINLWQAWQNELAQRHLMDETQAYIQQLQTALTNTHSEQHWFVYIAEGCNAIEQQWLDNLNEKAQVTIFRDTLQQTNSQQNTSQQTTAYTRNTFITQALSDTLNEAPAALTTNANTNAINIKQIPCASFEQEAQQVTAAILHYASIKTAEQRITLICEDRNFIRRLRALLEHQPIGFIDSFGWSLITTRAATFIQAILNCAENDFYYRDFIELLKSPFIENIISSQTVYRFEQDIIQHENISAGIKHYKKALQARAWRLGHWQNDEYTAVEQALTLIDSTCQALQKIQSQKNIEATDFINTLLQIIEQLQATTRLQKDEAGTVLLQMLADMLILAERHPQQLTYNACKQWLNFELTHRFLVGQHKNSLVQLLTLNQCHGLQTDFLIVANATVKQLPKINRHSYFFNQTIRAELNLVTQTTVYQQQKKLFTSVLARCTEALFTWQETQNETDNVASAWLTAIDNSYVKNFQTALPKMRFRFQQAQSYAAAYKPATHVTGYKALLPKRISVSDHQLLIDCPYAYFVNRILKLQASQSVKEKLEKNDFGSLVHKALQAFHFDIPHLPGPFTNKLTHEHKQAAIKTLTDISKKLFTWLADDNYENSVWFTKWVHIIPNVIDWEIAQNSWQPQQGESSFEFTITGDYTLRGTIDRLDIDSNGTQRLLDYKTGLPPSNKAIQSGEDVQLALYSLAYPTSNESRYIGIAQQMQTNAAISGDVIEEIKTQAQQRLVNIQTRLDAGEAIPIWSNNARCRLCKQANICRHNRDF